MGFKIYSADVDIAMKVYDEIMARDLSQWSDEMFYDTFHDTFHEIVEEQFPSIYGNQAMFDELYEIVLSHYENNN